MTIAAKPVPDGYHGCTPYLIVKGAAAAIDFYKVAFGAAEIERMLMADGKVGHAEILIGAAPVMLADEFPEMGMVSPIALGGSPVALLLYVGDVDAFFATAVTAGATVVSPVQDQFYGDRSGKLVDPFGHIWNIATRTEDLTPAEMQARAAAQAGVVS